MKTHASITLVALLAVAACGPIPQKNAAPSAGEQLTPVISVPSQSACLQPAEISEGGIRVVALGNTLQVVDPEAMFNCCLNAGMEARVDGHHVIVVEREEQDPSRACNCICPYELSIEISDLPDGDYTVSVYRDSEDPDNLLTETQVSLPGTSPVILPSHQSECLSPDDSDAPTSGTSVQVQTSGTALTVVDSDALFNCCLDVWMEVTIEGSTITVLEREDPDNSNACDCNCIYELSVRVENLAPGRYTVEVYRYAIQPDLMIHQESVTLATTGA